MSNIIRDADVDIEVMRSRCGPQNLDDAAEAVERALRALSGLQEHRQDNEPAHEVTRALWLVRDAVNDALTPADDDR